MKLSIFVTVTDPLKRQDPFVEALASYIDLADEIVVVDGANKSPDYRIPGKTSLVSIHYPWPEEFEWSFIGEQFQRGYDACTGDWVIRMDCDYLIHEQDMDAIRTVLALAGDAPAVSFWKYQFLMTDRYQIKSRLPLALNKGKYGSRIQLDGGGDLCQPTLDGVIIDLNTIPEAKRPIYNYDFCFKTQETVAQDFSRFTRAWGKQFGNYPFGGPTPGEALEGFKKMMVGRFNSRGHEIITLDRHPKYIQQRIKNMTPEQFGYNLWGLVETKNTYFKEVT